jgi:hypothetical protein
MTRAKRPKPCNHPHTERSGGYHLHRCTLCGQVLTSLQLGLNPRWRKTNPRAQGNSPRQRGVNPRRISPRVDPLEAGRARREQEAHERLQRLLDRFGR